MDEIAFIDFNGMPEDKKNSIRLTSLVTIDELSSIVTATANNIFSLLKPGLPQAVYQLKLLNDLLRKGLTIKTEMSMLNCCVKNEPVRELIIVENTIVIECIVESTVTEHNRKRVMFDLENNSHARGLLINFSEKMKSDMFTIVNNNSVLH